MNREQALSRLGLDVAVNPAELQGALVERAATLEKRRNEAPTEALRNKYQRQLDELEQARAVLVAPEAPSGLSQTMMADLPMAQAAYTRMGTGGAARTLGITVQPGQVIGGRYEVREQIGAGGMGAVYRAFDRNRDKDIAMKVLLPAMLSSPKARERFLAEARLSTEMAHPNIVTMFDVQQDGPYYFLTMELLQGQSLRAWLAAHRKNRRTVALVDALSIATQVCQALAYAHQQHTVHRDIKPENIWLTSEGRAKVMDFGIARLQSNTQAAQTQMAMGTAYYMAPEQLTGQADIDGRADQYAVGVLVYEMLAGQLPIGRSEPLHKLRPDVGRGVSGAVDRALSQRADQRFADMNALAEALSGKGSLLAPWQQLNEAQRRISLAVLGGVVVLGVGVPLVMALVSNQQAGSQAQQDAVRLKGEAQVLLKDVDMRRKELSDATTTAAREVEKLDGQLRSSRSAADSVQLRVQQAAARERQALADTLDQAYKQWLEGSEGLAKINGQLASADELLRTKQQTAAATQLSQVVQALQGLKAKPAEFQTQLDTARQRLLASLNGQWVSARQNDCARAKRWTVKERQIVVSEPDQSNTVLSTEQIVSVLPQRITTFDLSDPSNPAAFDYHLSDGQLVATQVAGGKSVKMKRCE